MLLAVGVVAQSTPSLSVEAVSTLGTSGLAQLDVYTRIPHARLTFLNQAQGQYVAEYDITATLWPIDEDGKRGDILRNQLWQRSVTVPRYEATQADTAYHYSTASLTNVPSGTYFLETRFEEPSTNDGIIDRRMIQVRNFSAAVSISDLLLLDEYNDLTKAITPNVANIVGVNHPRFVLFYELFTDTPQQVQVNYEILRYVETEGPGFFGSIWRTMKSWVGFGGSAEVVPELAFNFLNTRFVRPGRNPATFAVPLDQFAMGAYQIRVIITTVDGEEIGVAEKTFAMQWMDPEERLRNLAAEIAQVERYLAKPDDIEHIRAGATPEAQIERLDAFWQKRDPSPGTERNEAREEFYARVAYANDHYGVRGQAGWQSDRAQILVQFGQPDEVAQDFNENHYEIWKYRSLRKQFVFVDETGFGDFKLLEKPKPRY